MLESALRILHVRGQGGVGGQPLLRLGRLAGVELGDLPLALADGDVVHHAREERSHVRVEAGLHGDERGAALTQGAQHGVEVEVRPQVDVGAGLGQARLVAGEVRGGGPRHQEDGAVGEFLHPVGGRGQHALAAHGLHQLGAEDVEPEHLVDLVEPISHAESHRRGRSRERPPTGRPPGCGLGVGDWVVGGPGADHLHELAAALLPPRRRRAACTSTVTFNSGEQGRRTRARASCPTRATSCDRARWS